MKPESKSAKSRVLATTSIAALAIAAASGLGAGALAQEEEGAAERIVVTGSRIVRRDFEANSPIVTIEADTFENRSSFNLESALNQLPQFTPDGTGLMGAGPNPAATPFASAANAPGAATLNLRGLDSNRSLVLVNGRRPQPVNAQLVVDINSIPSAAIENVEVITGGAAAVYGADAIAGVVNFKLREDFEGFEVDSQYGITEQGDNVTAQLSAVIGGNFDDDRGNAMVGVVWSQRGEAYQRDRDFFTRGWQDPGTTGGGVTQSDVTQAIINNVAWGVNDDGTMFQINQADNASRPFTGPLNAGPGGSGFKLNPLASSNATFRTLGYNDPAGELSIPMTRYSAFASAHYDINDNITAFVEANYTHNYTSAISLIPPAFNIWSLSVPYNQANDDPDSLTFGATPSTWHPVPRALADLLNQRAPRPYCLFGATGCNPAFATSDPLLVGTPHPNQPWTLTRGLDFLGRLRTDTTSNIFQITPGFRGDLPFKDWTYEVYGSHGATDVTAEQLSGSISQENIQQIINGVSSTNTSGFPPPVPRITSTGPWSQGWTNGETLAVIGSCASGIPIFNPDGSVPDQVTVTQDCIDYASLRQNNTTHLEQNIFEATMQGGLFDLPWSDEVRFALGATYRDVNFMFNPDASLNANQARANVINLIALPRFTEGYFSVSEVYGEALVPVLRDLPGIQALDLELGYRYSDYSTAGGVDTYKMLMDWEITDWARFRGGYQLANRAPNVYELFAPVSGSGNFPASNDACTNIPGFTAAYGNLATNPNRVNLQLACAELIRRDGGFDYQTLVDDPTNTGQNPALIGQPGFDDTHISNFRWTVLGYNFPFGINIPLVQGNPDLESERAETWTAGLVLRSPVEHPLLDGLSLSVDWYQIELAGTIETPGAMLVYSQCLDAQYNPLMASAPGSLTGAQLLAGSPFCDLINREPTNTAGAFAVPGSGIDRNYDAAFVNIGGTETAGIDVQVNWSADFADMGPLQVIPGSVNMNVVGNFLKEFSESPFAGAPFIDYTGTTFSGGQYDFRAFSTVGYNVGPASVGARVRFLSPIKPLPTATPGTERTAAHTEVDLFGRWTVNETIELRGGVDNVLDVQPEVVGATPFNNALSSTNQNYDVLGRRFFVGATLRY